MVLAQKALQGSSFQNKVFLMGSLVCPEGKSRFMPLLGPSVVKSQKKKNHAIAILSMNDDRRASIIRDNGRKIEKI